MVGITPTSKMSINLEAIRKKLVAMQQNSQGGGGSKVADSLWKPPVGKSQIRIVPYAHNKDNPFIELYFHYEIGKRTMLSPISFGKPDPIMEFADKLKKTGDKDDWKMGRKIEPKFRVYAPVIVRGEEAEGVRFWSFGKQIYTELLSLIADPDYGDITDLVNGRDITIEHIAPEKEGAFPTYTVRVKPNTTPASNDKAELKKIVGEQKDIAELFTQYSYDELKEALAKWLDPEGADDGTKSATQTAGTKNAKSTDDVTAAFDQLFDKAK